MVAYLVIFFFKQKAAYEMRISDWSSDVCSSDLVLLHPTADQTQRFADGERRATRRALRDWQRLRAGGTLPTLQALSPLLDFVAWEDRTSAVSGKSVSERVDLGGRRILQKKTHKTKQTLNDYIPNLYHYHR